MRGLIGDVRELLGNSINDLASYLRVGSSQLRKSNAGLRALPHEAQMRFAKLLEIVLPLAEGNQTSAETEELELVQRNQATYDAELRKAKRDLKRVILKEKLRVMRKEYASAKEAHRILSISLQTEGLDPKLHLFLSGLKRNAEAKLHKYSLSNQQMLEEQLGE